MHQTIDILFGVAGQALFFDAPEGRPSSVVSSTVYENSEGDDGTSEVALSGSAAIETNPNTTFDAASGVTQSDPTLCRILATTGCVVGRRYSIKNAFGERETVEIARVTSGDSVNAREPLQNDYASADTFVSTRITHVLDTTWLSDTGNLSDDYGPNARYRWRLVYIVDGVTYVHDAYFDLVRYPARFDTTALDVDRKYPGWVSRLPTNYRDDQGRALLDEAFSEVKFDLYNQSKSDQSIRNREVVNELVALRAGVLTNEPNAQARYDARFSQLMTWTKVPTSDASGAASIPRPRPILRR